MIAILERLLRWLEGRRAESPTSRIEARRIQRADYMEQWRRHEPGFVRCQECLEVLKMVESGWTEHDCRNPNPPITVTMRWEP